ncbi:hypothetical protein [Granulicella sp. S156]|uniref:hypothetical protein n=1 Tax=Granulicella sp. S156 TaxID=1747224 RepID=UPI00131D1BEF|nr:hypothetical protein [Granulicella sp. S156]
MNKLKLAHGISKVRRAKLQSSIDQTIADDIELMADWSNNETQYVVNELLRFAIAQEEDYLKYKASVAASAGRSASHAKPASIPVKPIADSVSKSDPTTSSTAAHA